MAVNATAICDSPSDRFRRRSSRTMTGSCRSLPRTQQGENMLILLKTQVDRTAKTPVTARRARGGGLCGFRGTVGRRTHQRTQNRTLRRRAGALRKWQTQKKDACRRILAEEEAASGVAGQSRGVVRIPRRSHLPAVRAVSGICEGVIERAKIALLGS